MIHFPILHHFSFQNLFGKQEENLKWFRMTFSKESEHNDVHKNIFPNSTPYSDVTFVIQAKRERRKSGKH